MRQIAYTTNIDKYVIQEYIEGYYKILIRDNIVSNGSNSIYDEYYIIKKKEDFDKDTFEENFDGYLEAARIQERLDNKEKEIKKLKDQLTGSDYKLLKCTENYMIGAILPYDFSQLLSQRMAIRDKINNIEIDATEEDILSQAKSRKISEMSAINQTIITNGIDYNGSHYRLNTTDQLNLTSLYAMAQLGSPVPYHADNELCKVFMPEEMIELVQSSMKFIMYHTTYFNLLKHQILEYETEEEVNSVYYGIDLKPQYQAIITAISGVDLTSTDE